MILDTQIQQIYPEDEMEIATTIEGDKEYLLSVYVCPASSRTIFDASLQNVYLDCILLKNETGGALYVAFTLDGGNKSVLLAYMITEEESHQNWHQFLTLLERSHIVSSTSMEYSIIQSLIIQVESLFPKLVAVQPELSFPSNSWYSTNPRRKKGTSHQEFPSLRSLFFRIIFSSSEIPLLMEQFFSENRDLLSTLSHYPKWNRRLFESPHVTVTEFIVKEFEMNVLEQRSIRYLMLDDVITGLYTIQIEKSQERHQFYSSIEPSTSYTPFYCALLNEYSTSKEVFTVQTQDKVHFIVVLASNPSIHFSIDFLAHSCSCGYWQESHFPCIHVWNVVQTMKMSLEPLTQFFTCASALTMAPQLEVPQFNHSLSQQVHYYIQGLQTMTKEVAMNGDYVLSDPIELPSVSKTTFAV